MVLNEDVALTGDTKPLKAGTVTEVGNDGEALSKQNDDGKTRLKFNDKQTARETFEMLGESVTSDTFVEVSLLTGSTGKKQYGYVTTASQVGKDNSMTPVILNTYQKDKHSEYIHTHPFTIDMSGDDSFFDKLTDMYTGKSKKAPRMGIYFTGNNSKSEKLNHVELNPFKNSYLYWHKK